MIRDYDIKRCVEDSKMAIQALNAIVEVGTNGYLHESYLKEKATIAKRCADFMVRLAEHYEDEEDEDV